MSSIVQSGNGRREIEYIKHQAEAEEEV